jgi:hypothetical protein
METITTEFGNPGNHSWGGNERLRRSGEGLPRDEISVSEIYTR